MTANRNYVSVMICDTHIP